MNASASYDMYEVMTYETVSSVSWSSGVEQGLLLGPGRFLWRRRDHPVWGCTRFILCSGINYKAL